jgi:hypothetical protein
MSRDTHRVGEQVAKLPVNQLGQEFQAAKLTLSGASEAVTFKGLGLEDMADDQYVVLLSGEFASTAYVDESTISETGFTIVDGANTEVAHLLIVGKVASRKRY